MKAKAKIQKLLNHTYSESNFDALVQSAKDADFAKSVLEDLDTERGKFTESDEDLMRLMTRILVEAGVYPPLSEKRKEQNFTHYSLVSGYGAYWHLYRGLIACPHCKADLRSPDGPPFKLEMGIEITQLYDGTAYYQCPECKGAWSRKGTPMTEDDVRGIMRRDI